MLTFISKEPIDKGWSGDRKFRVTDAEGKSYLLRTSPADKYEKREKTHRFMEAVAKLGVPMCLPLEFGECAEGVYSLQSWIEGRDAEEVLRELTPSAVYAYGFEAGVMLKKIHSLKAPEDSEDWESYFNRKADKKIKMYEECTLKYENGQAFIDFIKENRHLLKDRPLTYQHGDYHVGNMMIGNDGQLYIIDFDRCDVGDPWEEFNRIVWCAQKTPPFAAGMVNGYFGCEVPMEFWRLLALYISANTLSSLPWAVPFGEEQIEIMKKQGAEVLYWYDGMKNPVPRWYTEWGAGLAEKPLSSAEAQPSAALPSDGELIASYKALALRLGHRGYFDSMDGVSELPTVISRLSKALSGAERDNLMRAYEAYLGYNDGGEAICPVP